MKTQTTIETTRNQEMMIGLAETGELVKAGRKEVASYFSDIIQAELDMLSVQADDLIRKVAAAKANTEV